MSIGSVGEDLSCKYLENKGFHILNRNYHSRFGEIDIIAKYNDVIVFVEVKARSSFSYGTPLEAINRKKLQKIVKTSQFYINQFKLGDVNYRFDAIEVIFVNGNPEINHIENITL